MGFYSPLPLAAALAALAALGLAWWRWRRVPRSRPPTLRPVGTVSGLFVYPIKSCRGVAVERAQVTELGLRSGDLRDRIFGTDIQGRDCGEEAAQWITAFLKSESYRLVHFEPNMTPRKSKDLVDPFRSSDKIAYPDLGPVMVLSEASLEDLNSRLDKKVQMRNFRPNILVTGCGPHEEDTWDEIVIGDVEMKGAMACPRCIFTTIDPDTGIMDRKEPLETLKSYRLCDPSEQHIYKSHPLFGWYFGIDKTGTIQVGDLVYKISW
ncbi:mitochondrial amidoxime reducing component 2 isoform X2 [Anolis carolinensis]|uniref:mitochondrial amidoxime reducing component 2 isoform X2 n=1 Tax=Anolis carolinensis TaxID=28377 RepID=UPI000462C907|nr:PREDICTED: mitochondrial amidoxime reducing component 2 isoform X2 [Anolis carolinensis]|eukprot:XP_008124074.1 PREDICTED: mitochondrial amidoxime reducing component 2 isoform X2 [Anolis carolinensis]